jgi:hypothetical protein
MDGTSEEEIVYAILLFYVLWEKEEK